ncbi:MAG: hypothetical protein JEZ07_08520 [Phycisphaerae bacterium]|nr:hypothetical protein [Phycisphaerae bacterium]
MIKFICDSCDKKLSAPVQYQGKAVKCPHCKVRLIVPAEQSCQREEPESIWTDELINETLNQPKSLDSNEYCPDCGLEITIQEKETTCPHCKADFRPQSASYFVHHKNSSIPVDDPIDKPVFYKASAACFAGAFIVAVAWAWLSKMTGVSWGIYSWFVGIGSGVGGLLLCQKHNRSLGVVAAAAAFTGLILANLLFVIWVGAELRSRAESHAQMITDSTSNIAMRVQGDDVLIWYINKNAKLKSKTKEIFQKLQVDELSFYDIADEQKAGIAKILDDNLTVIRKMDFDTKKQTLYEYNLYYRHQAVDNYQSTPVFERFRANMGLLSIVWYLLAITSAYKICGS